MSRGRAMLAELSSALRSLISRPLNSGVSSHCMRSVVFHQDPPNDPIVAITDFDATEVASLRCELKRLAQREVEAVVVDGDVRLSLRAGQRDIGIVDSLAADPVWVLRPNSWLQISELLEPFTEPGVDGFQWLDDTGAAKLLISRTGKW